MPVLSGGVMVAQESLELFVMVRIHAGQPFTSPDIAVAAYFYSAERAVSGVGEFGGQGAQEAPVF
jgi:hypothetical protein